MSDMSEDLTQDRRRFTTPAGEQGMFDPAHAQPGPATPEDVATSPGGGEDSSAVQGMTQAMPAAATATTAPLPIEGTLPSLDGASAWLNSQPLTADSLRGKVIAVDFWTYTCINWLRTLPYVRAWAERYKDRGLVVIGVHTPEFPFEHDIENVRQAAKDMRVEYPIAIDNAYAIWHAFSNHYWPALYLVDAMGRIRHHHFGEGDYERSELIIQRLLDEAGMPPAGGGGGHSGHDLVSVEAGGLEAAADWSSVQSAETYLGSERGENFASPGGAVVGERHIYTAPARLRLNEWALVGEWTMEEGASALSTAGGRIAYRFHARDVNLVMGPAARGGSVRFRVLLDGQAPSAAHGSDVDEHGTGVAADQRVYQLIRQPQPITDHLFEIEFLDAGVEAFAFTFG